MINIHQSGAKQIEMQLSRIERNVAKKIVRKAVREGQKIITEKVKDLAPEDEGIMKGAIVTRAAKRQRRGSYSVLTVFDTKRYPSLIRTNKAGQRYFYPAAVECGTENQKANPFMRLAVYSAQDRAEREVIQILNDGILQAMRGG